MGFCVAPLHDRPRDCITRANPCESIRQPDLFERGADLSEIYQLWLSASYTDDLAAERQHRDVPVQTLSRAFESTRRQDLHSEASSDKIRIDDKKVTHLQLSQLYRSPTPDMKAVPVGDPQVIEVTGDVIFAIPIGAISDLVDWDVFFSASELANVRRLPTQPMASLDVYFKKKLRNVPSGVTLLQDLPYNLTFVDNSQLWKDGGPPGVTFLNLVMSDFMFLPITSIRPCCQTKRSAKIKPR